MAVPGTLRFRVLQALLAAGCTGHTDQELQEGLGMDPSTERPRRVELMDRGLICDSGETRRTRSGRRAVVWVAVPKAAQMPLPYTQRKRR